MKHNLYTSHIMSMNDLRKAYEKQLPKRIVKYINYKLLVFIPIMLYFGFSDMYFRHNIFALYTRILPFCLGIALLIFNFFFKAYEKPKANLYKLLLFSLLLMMFAKCLIHLNDGLASNVSGTIMVLFVVSLELRLNHLKSLLFFFIPPILFLIVLISFFEVDKNQILILSNIFPIVFLGLLINRTQEKLRFKSFSQNFLLKIEQQKTHEQNKMLTAQKLALVSQAKELKLLNSSRNKFFSIIAHDLRNPFNAIFGYSQLIKEKAITKDDNELLKYSSLIYDTAYQSYNLLNNLLNWARLQTGHLIFSPVELNVHELILSSISFLQANIDEKHIQINTGFDSNNTVFADLFMLETIIRNIISNPIKFTHEQGEIEVTVSSDRHNLSIVIRDNGVGMSDNKIKKLFNIEEQSSTKGTKKETGTGLGLLLCKEFIEQHDGEILVESELNKGSVFTIVLPLPH